MISSHFLTAKDWHVNTNVLFGPRQRSRKSLPHLMIVKNGAVKMLLASILIMTEV